MTMAPIIVFWALAGTCLLRRGAGLFTLLFASMSFGAFACVPVGLAGGLTLTPTPVVMVLLISRAMLSRQGPAGMLALAIQPARMLLLLLYWLVATLTTLFMPRLLEGAVMVVPVRGILDTTSALRPSMQNLSQWLYVSISVAGAFAMAHLLESHARRQQALQALCIGGAVAVLTGLADYASSFLPLDGLLSPLRTASYALLTDVEVLGGKRVVGLMPEASAYGGLCLGLMAALYAYRPLIADYRWREILCPLLIGLLGLCTWVSTSSGAMVGLAILLLVCTLDTLRRMLASPSRSPFGPPPGTRGSGQLLLIGLVIAGICALAMLDPRVFDPIAATIDRMVLQKASSSSYEERGMWRAVAISALEASHGAGIGLGSTRTSSGVVAVFAGSGVLGGILFYGFVLQTALRTAPRRQAWRNAFYIAFRISLIPPFAISLMVGDADFGALMAFALGLTTAVAKSRAPDPRRSAISDGTPPLGRGGPSPISLPSSPSAS